MEFFSWGVWSSGVINCRIGNSGALIYFRHNGNFYPPRNSHHQHYPINENPAKKLPNSELRTPVPEKTYHPQINPVFFPVCYFRFLVRINSVSLLRDIFFSKKFIRSVTIDILLHPYTEKRLLFEPTGYIYEATACAVQRR